MDNKAEHKNKKAIALMISLEERPDFKGEISAIPVQRCR